MKTFLPVLVLVVLAAAMPAIAAEPAAPLPDPAPAAALTSPDLAPAAAPQAEALPSWLVAEPSTDGFMTKAENAAAQQGCLPRYCNSACLWCQTACGGYCMVFGGICQCQ